MPATWWRSSAPAGGTGAVHQAVTELAALGVTQFVEIGAGSVLSGLVKRIDRSAQAISLSSPDGLVKLEAARV